MADEGYYDKFLRNAGQLEPKNEGQEELSLEITIKIPSDRKTLRKWFFWWYFIQACACGVILSLFPAIISLNIMAMIFAVPAIFVMWISWRFQRDHSEIYKEIFKRLLSKEKKDDV
jgi:hypothetical protein